MEGRVGAETTLVEEDLDALFREHLRDGAEGNTSELYRSVDLIAAQSDKVCKCLHKSVNHACRGRS
jgi:hypothetical protein